MKQKGFMYLIGPISGLPRKEAVENFEKAEKVAIELGYVPINPLKIVPMYIAELEKESKSARRLILQMVLAKLLESHAVLIQYDYEKNSGCRIEHKIAEEEGYTTYYLDSSNTQVHFTKKYEHRNHATVKA